MTDQEALQVVQRSEGASIPTLDILAKASCIAFRRLAECQWHEYVKNDPELLTTMCRILLDVEFDDGSTDTIFGHVGLDADCNIICVPNDPNRYVDNAKIRHWAKLPQYKNRLPKGDM